MRPYFRDLSLFFFCLAAFSVPLSAAGQQQPGSGGGKSFVNICRDFRSKFEQQTAMLGERFANTPEDKERIERLKNNAIFKPFQALTKNPRAGLDQLSRDELTRDCERLRARVLPYCPDGDIAKLRANIERRHGYSQQLEAQQKRLREIEADSKKLRDEITASLPALRTRFAAIAGPIVSIGAGLGMGLAVYHLLHRLAGGDGALKAKKKDLQRLKAVHAKLRGTMRRAREALESSTLDAKLREQMTAYLEKQQPVFREQAQNIAELKRAITRLERQRMVLRIGVPVASVLTAVATTLTAHGIFTWLSPQSSPAKRPLAPEVRAAREASLARLEKNQHSVRERCRELEAEVRKIPTLSREIQLQLIGLLDREREIKALARRDDQRSAEAVQGMLQIATSLKGDIK
ncbi:MAG: hypothetical protein M1549_00375 [Candidatus Dependentiae bacterium]|nr:hypothetical protein [Candidatus Dependentiae bacterium]